MNANIQLVNKYFDLTSPKGRNIEQLLPQIGELLIENFQFTGPLMKIEGRDQYLNLLNQFLQLHDSFKIHKLFSSNDDVCATTELIVNAPNGAKIKMNLAEIFKVSSGKIITHEIYYDPNEFAKAFGMNKEKTNE